MKADAFQFSEQNLRWQNTVMSHAVVIWVYFTPSIIAIGAKIG